MRGLAVVLSSALPVAELPRGTEICWLKNSGSFRMEKMEFHGGPYKDLQRHAFSEVTVAAPLPAETPSIPMTMSSGDG